MVVVVSDVVVVEVYHVWLVVVWRRESQLAKLVIPAEIVDYWLITDGRFNATTSVLLLYNISLYLLIWLLVLLVSRIVVVH